MCLNKIPSLLVKIIKIPSLLGGVCIRKAISFSIIKEFLYIKSRKKIKVIGMAKTSEYKIEREFLGKITCEELIYRIILFKLQERR